MELVRLPAWLVGTQMPWLTASARLRSSIELRQDHVRKLEPQQDRSNIWISKAVQYPETWLASSSLPRAVFATSRGRLSKRPGLTITPYHNYLSPIQDCFWGSDQALRPTPCCHAGSPVWQGSTPPEIVLVSYQNAIDDVFDTLYISCVSPGCHALSESASGLFNLTLLHWCSPSFSFVCLACIPRADRAKTHIPLGPCSPGLHLYTSVCRLSQSQPSCIGV
jgi:hypothetical protein